MCATTVERERPDWRAVGACAPRADGEVAQARTIWSIFAARMKSLRVRPAAVCVQVVKASVADHGANGLPGLEQHGEQRLPDPAGGAGDCDHGRAPYNLPSAGREPGGRTV